MLLVVNVGSLAQRSNQLKYKEKKDVLGRDSFRLG